MNTITRSRPSPAFVLAAIALFVALGGSAVALSGKNTVFSDDIVNGQVKRPDLKKNSVNGAKVKNGSLKGVDIDESSLGTVPLATNANQLGGTPASGFARGFTAAEVFTAGESLALTVPGVGTLAIDCSNGGTAGNEADDRVGDFRIVNQSGSDLVYAWFQRRTDDSFEQADWTTRPTGSNMAFSSGANDALWTEFIASRQGGGVAATFQAFGSELAGQDCLGVINAVRNS